MFARVSVSTSRLNWTKTVLREGLVLHEWQFCTGLKFLNFYHFNLICFIQFLFSLFQIFYYHYYLSSSSLVVNLFFRFFNASFNSLLFLILEIIIFVKFFYLYLLPLSPLTLPQVGNFFSHILAFCLFFYYYANL